VALAQQISGSSECFAMGDDCLEPYTFGAIDEYRRRGHVLKEYVRSDGEFEFCSNRFVFDGRPKAEPLNWERMLFRLLNQRGSEDDLEEYLSQFKYEMRNSPHLDESLHVLMRVGWGPYKNNQNESADVSSTESTESSRSSRQRESDGDRSDSY
jgi:hypothetical protein